MKSLPNVTLISYDNTNDPSRTLKALQYCASLIQFACVIIVCRTYPRALGEVTMHRVDENGYADAMKWEVSGIKHDVYTDFALCIQHDGYILNPDKWNDDWLNYDFIGAPWPREAHPNHPGKSNYPYRVGNTGFCLKSKRFIQETAGLQKDFIEKQKSEGSSINWRGLGGDTFYCQYQREALERKGMKYAPIEVAADFAWEDNIEEFPNGRPDAFGFHNFDFGGKTVPRI